jgi:Fe-Mn family superoxide dismutase
MAYTVKPLACDPARIKGMSEKLLVSHYENNYGGAVNRLNARRKASCATRSPAISGVSIAGGPNSRLWAKRRAADPDGCC